MLTRSEFSFSLDSSVDSPPSKRVCPESFLSSGVKKLHIIAIVEGIPETYSNVKKIMSELQLDKFDFFPCN